MVFFSGTERIPPLGFEQQPTIEFIQDQSKLYCTASTCDLVLRLPTRYQDYPSFRGAMLMSIIDNDGFGGV